MKTHFISPSKRSSRTAPIHAVACTSEKLQCLLGYSNWPQKDLCHVNWWPLALIQHQQESPVWGGDRADFIQCNHFTCDTAKLWNSGTKTAHSVTAQLQYSTWLWDRYGGEAALICSSSQLPISKIASLAWCWSLAPLRQHGSLPLWSGNPASTLHFQPGKHSSMERECVCLEPEGSWLV